MHSHFWKVLLGAILVVMLAGPVGAKTLTRDHLDNQAGSYLDLLDQGRYEEAWLAMSTFFQALKDKAQWQSRQQVIRDVYGSLLSRKFLRISYRQSYSQSPDGKYVIVQYRSIFQNKADTYETVVLDCRNNLSCSVREYVLR
ncbi:MAG: DUF4019 domain-containing protein [Desulfuromonadales bacterium]|nr:DUF4019 domain-containing protein [Desulfuromonadales bacterium]